MKPNTMLNPAQFADFCEKNFDLNSKLGYHYESMSICILDCVYSLRAKYESMTVPVVERYAKVHMGRNRHAGGDTVSMLINNIDADSTQNIGIRIVCRLASDINYMHAFETNNLIISFDL